MSNKEKNKQNSKKVKKISDNNKIIKQNSNDHKDKNKNDNRDDNRHDNIKQNMKNKNRYLNNENLVQDESKRDFVTALAVGLTVVGTASLLWPFVHSLNPSKEVKALSKIEVDLKNIQVGETKTVMWQGKPIFIKRRTEKEIKQMRQVDISKLIDPESDVDRVKKGKEEWLIAIGICTHLGCVPIANAGDYKAWFCPCHGSHYDASGRIRKGPAPKNLLIPKYEFVNNNLVVIG